MSKRVTISLFFVLISVSISSIQSCSRHIHKTKSTPVILYPSPPDTARFQFLTRYASSKDIEEGASQFRSFIAGTEESLPIKKPYGIAIHNGKIYIIDTGISGLDIIDLGKNTFEYFLPPGNGSFKFPINCVVDDTGNLYVADLERKQVVIFNENLEYKDALTGTENFKPTDLIIVGDTIFVTDPNNNRINAYEKETLELLFSFPDNAKVGNEQWLYNPLNLCAFMENIYVTDFGDSKVKVYNSDGQYITSVGSYGRNLGQFVRPKGIATDNEGNLFVVDAAFQNIQVFNREGQLLIYFGGPYQGLGDMYLPADVSIDYENLEYFRKYVDPAYNLKYLIFVTNQYGPDKVSVYGRITPK